MSMLHFISLFSRLFLSGGVDGGFYLEGV